jgi:hypothetical protein
MRKQGKTEIWFFGCIGSRAQFELDLAGLVLSVGAQAWMALRRQNAVYLCCFVFFSSRKREKM